MGAAVDQVVSRRDMARFIGFPLRLYANDPCFVPHLLLERRQFFNPKTNPLFEFTDAAYFLARDGTGGTVGRISAHVNRRHNELADERCGFFGFFESTEDGQVAEALLSAAEGWLRGRGMSRIRGPLSFSTNEECGFLAEGFDRMPAFMMPYTKPYYLDFMSHLDYAKAMDLLAYEYDSGGIIPEHLVRFRRRVQERTDATVRPIDMRHFRADVERAFSVYNRAWEQNWGFVPMTPAQFSHMADELGPIIDPEVVLIAEIDGEAVGFSLALPDLNPLLKRMNGRLLPFGIFRFLLGRRRAGRIRVLTMGVVKEHRKRGLEALLIYQTFRNGHRRGYQRGEFSWVLEDNVLLIRALERFGAAHTKTYRIFEKEL